MTTRPLACVLAVTLVAAVGCQSPLHDDNLALHDENRQLRERIDTLEAGQGGIVTAQSPTPTPSEPAPQIEPTPEPSPAERENGTGGGAGGIVFGQPSPRGGQSPAIEGVESEFDAASGEQTLRVPGDVLFDSGQATLRPNSRQTLQRIARALNAEYAERPVRIEGHTDSDPIRRSRDRFPTNESLSEARAAAVRDFLEQQGVSSDRMRVVGHGAARPLGGQKAADRRVEIVVVTR